MWYELLFKQGCLALIYLEPTVILCSTGFLTVGYEAEWYTVTESETRVELAIVITDPPSGSPASFTLLLNTYNDNAGIHTSKMY